MDKRWVFVIKVILLILVVIAINNKDLINQHIIADRGFKALYTFLSTSVLISISRYIILFFYRKRRYRQVNLSLVDNFTLGINQLAEIFNVLFIVIAIFVLLGIDLKEFLTSITLIAMAVALIFREYITNMISGLIIMFSDKYMVSDYIKLGEYTGRIENIGLQNTRIKTEDGDSVLIPNNAFFISNIVNKSIENKGRYVIEFQLPFNDKLEIDQLQTRSEEHFKGNTDIEVEQIKVSVSKIHFEYIQYKLTLVYKDIPGINYPKIKSDYLKFILSLI